MANVVQKRWTHNMENTYDFARERIMLVLRCFDKIDPEKLTLDSHFKNDLGLNSLDHVEIMIELEDEFLYEIPDKDAEKLVTPRHILKYITDKDEAYEELQKIRASQPHHHNYHHLFNPPEHDHHDHHAHGHEHEHNHVHTHASTSSSEMPHGKPSINLEQKRAFSSLTQILRAGKLLTTFGQKPRDPPNFDDIQSRVMKVCSKYDKIDASKLELASHFVQDLGLDSLDHVEIIMELEDEFGLEIPDKDAEKLMRPAEIASYVFKKEDSRFNNISTATDY